MEADLISLLDNLIHISNSTTNRTSRAPPPGEFSACTGRSNTKRRCLSQVKLFYSEIEGHALRQARVVPSNVAGTIIGQLVLCPRGGNGGNSWL